MRLTCFLLYGLTITYNLPINIQCMTSNGKATRKQLAKIDGKAIRDELYDSAERLGDLQNVEQVKKLTNHKYGYRLRVGRY